MVLAEKMAQHYQSTLYRIRLGKKKHTKQWLAIPKEERQDMIETFAVILGKAGDAQLDDATNVSRPNMTVPRL